MSQTWTRKEAIKAFRTVPAFILFPEIFPDFHDTLKKQIDKHNSKPKPNENPNNPSNRRKNL